MAWHAFDPMVARDATTGALVTAGTGTIHALTDTAGATPLAVTDLSGVPWAGGLVPVVGGLTAGFRVENLTRVVWRSGTHVIPVWSPEAVEASASASATAATTAATSADLARVAAVGAAEAADAAGILAGGTTGQAMVKASDADRDVKWGPFSGLPDTAGSSPGDVITVVSGAPAWATPIAGVNDTGIGTLVADPASATRTALDVVIGDHKDPDLATKAPLASVRPILRPASASANLNRSGAPAGHSGPVEFDTTAYAPYTGIITGMLAGDWLSDRP